MKAGNLLWWACYVFAAVALQSFMPGIDFLLPGFLLALQERKPEQSVCVGIAFLMLQEGMGSMAFGGTFILYSLAALLFYSGSGLFHGRSVLFLILLGTVLAAAHFVVVKMMAGLQYIPWSDEPVFHECLFQAFFTPFAWWTASSLRRWAPVENRESKR